MQALRTKWLKLGGTLLAMTLWLVVSNHCALRAALAGINSTTAAAEDHSCCTGGAKPSTKTPADAQPSACCKDLNTLPGSAKSLEFASVPVALLPYLLLAPFLALEGSEQPAGAIQDTGPPPFVRSFAELTLRHCVPENAPPDLA